MSLIEALLLLLVLSRVLGELAARFGQPPMIGEIAAGILLGPSALNYVRFTTEIKAIVDLGVLLLVFIAAKPYGVAFDRAGKRIFVWAALAGKLQVFSADSLKLLAEAPTGERCWHFTFSPGRFQNSISLRTVK